MVDELLTAFITFFTVIDPIGTIPVFIGVTYTESTKNRKLIARKATITAAGVLLFFILLGEVLFNSIDISLSVFQMSGGIVLFLFAMTMIFGESKPEEELSKVDNKDDKAIYPLAMPSLASPGAILAAILLTENSKHDILDQVFVSITMLIVLFIAYILMYQSDRIIKVIGNSGGAIISRIMGLILSAVAAKNVLEGITDYFGI